MDDLTKELDEREIERIQRIVKHILPDTVLIDLLDDIFPTKKTKKSDEKSTPLYIPDDNLIPPIHIGKSYLIKPSQFDTSVKLIKTLAIDRKKPTVVYCSRFSPKQLMLGLISQLTRIPLKRLLTCSLKDKDLKSFSLILANVQDMPAVFLRDVDLDYPLFLANLESLKDWFHPEVILFDDCQKIPREESRDGGMNETDSIREELHKFAKEQALAVIAINST